MDAGSMRQHVRIANDSNNETKEVEETGRKSDIGIGHGHEHGQA